MSAYRCQDKGAKLIYKMKDNDKTLTDKVTDVIFGGKQTKNCNNKEVREKEK